MDGQAELDSLIRILDQVHASEFVLYVDPALVPLLSALAPYSLLQKHGVQALVPLNAQNAEIKQSNASAVVYITNSEPKSLALVAKNAKKYIGLSLTVVLVPEITPSVSLQFTRFGVLGDLDLVSWPIGFVPDAATPDILSLFHDASNRDPSAAVWPLVWALDHLQAQQTGAFGSVTAVGPRARQAASLLEQKRAEEAVNQQQQQASQSQSKTNYRFGYSSSTFFGTEVEQAIIIDRDIDLVTPLLCQTTYLGVLAETVGLSASGTTKTGLKASLRNDPVFAPIANSAFAEACESLHQSAKELQHEYTAGSATSEQAPSIAEIRSVVSKLGSLQATQRLVDTHTELASHAMATLERGVRREAYNLQTQILDGRISNTQAVAQIQDLIYQGASLPLVLRSLSLLCLVRGGLKENVLQALLYGDFLKTYGYQHLPTLHYLYERGLVFAPKGSSFLFSASPLASLSFGSGSGSGSGGGGGASPSSATAKPDSEAQKGLESSNSLLNGGNVMAGPQLVQAYPWSVLNKSYKSYPSDSEESKPYAGLVPITARITQIALGIIPKSKSPLEPEFTHKSYASKDLQSAREAKLRRTLLRNSPSEQLPVVLVVVIGGVTYAEAAAIKAAAMADTKKPRRVVIASSSVVTGDSLVL